ncbi:hypothetical protein F4823DRAFT_360034 [Ustulina deusta]|nr:hypothetical protein F4823DRAFT_360034 [Ustulina deusta]
MEALVALGLASNVVQFVDFASKLIHTYSRLRQGVAQSEYEYHRTITNHLVPIAGKVKSSAQTIAQSSATLTPEQKVLQPIADGCCELADKLVKRLDAYLVQYGHHGGRALLPRAKIAFKIIWEKSEVDEMIKQLEQFSKELHLHLTFEVWQAQKSQALRLAKDDDVKAVLDKTSQLESSLENLRLNVDETRNRQADVLRAVSDLAVGNSKFHAHASQQSISNQTAVSTSIDHLRQMVQTTHLESMNSLAQVAVKISQFFAAMATERQSLEQTIGNVLRPLMEEYKDLLLQETRKEFRGTARAHMEELLAGLTQNIDLSDFQQNSHTSHSHEYDEHPYYGTARNHETISQVQAYEEDHETGETRRNQERRSNIALIYQKYHQKKTRIGTFWLWITQTIQLRPSQPPLKMYNVGAHFIPSARWISTGCSIMYRRIDDGRGSPTFGFQFPTYRVISNHHEVWAAIIEGDISAVQEMLSQKHVLPSDRGGYGHTLLHLAALYNQVEISRTLLQSGADVNAQDWVGLTPIAYTILPFSPTSKLGQRYSVFHFFRSLSSMRMDSVWFNENFRFIYIWFLYMGLAYQEVSNTISDTIPSWLRACRAWEIDLDPENLISNLLLHIRAICLHSIELGGRTVISWCETCSSAPSGSQIYSNPRWHELALRLFDSIVYQAPGYELLQASREIPVAYCIAQLCSGFCKERYPDHACVLQPLDNSIIYRGYYVEPLMALKYLRLAEHIISAGIKQRPDCIFDSWEGRTIFGWFAWSGHEELWHQILEDNGIDPGWARGEDERRKRVATGDTSAHEVSIGIDVSKITEVTKRKAFVSGEED